MAPLLLLLSPLAAPSAHAAEVVWHGHYRGRALLYDSLSLVGSETNANSLDGMAFTDHRFRLSPTLHVGSRVALVTQVDFLPLTPWGDAVDTWIDPVTDTAIPMAFADGVAPYDNEDDGGSYLRNLQVTRAYADVYTPVGRLRFGRMPMEWGAGVLFDPGLDPSDEYGDTGDRVQFTSRVGPVYLMGGWEMIHEGFVAERDDMQALDFAVAWRTETMGLGLYNRYRYHPINDFNAYTGSLWGYAELGPVKVETEVVGVAGRGDLDTGANDVTIASIGAVLNASVKLEKVYGGLEVGYANGDGDTSDSRITTFTFDRDHNVALMMFEEPMPLMRPAVLNDTNGGFDTSAVRTGEGVRNAIYFTPKVGYHVRPDLDAELSIIGARAAQVPTVDEDRKGYGWEFDAKVDYRPIEHFTLSGTAGLFLPGSYYSSYEHDDLGGGFGDPTLGGRIQATVDF